MQEEFSVLLQSLPLPLPLPSVREPVPGDPRYFLKSSWRSACKEEPMASLKSLNLGNLSMKRACLVRMQNQHVVPCVMSLPSFASKA